MTAVIGVEQQRARYAQAREALWGKPRIVNRVVEEKRAVEEYRRAERDRWEREQKQQKAMAEQAKREVANISKFSVSYQATVAFDTYVNQPFSLHVDTLMLRPTMERIARNVLMGHPGIRFADLRSGSRTRVHVAARKAVAKAIHRMRPDKSFTEIGRFLNRDHTTILALLDRLECKRRKAAA
jgi:hypothetical protein